MTSKIKYLKKKKIVNILSDGSTQFNNKFALKSQYKYCIITQDLSNNSNWVKSGSILNINDKFHLFEFRKQYGKK
jgi:hypothetical protein